MATSKLTAAQTMSLLEERLRRVDYALNGDRANDIELSTAERQTGSAAARLRNLERTLQSLAAQSSSVTDVLALQKKHPHIFDAASPSEVPRNLSLDSLAAIVLSHAQLYQSVAARLTQVQETSIPDPSAAARLIELRPRIEKVQARQQAQAREFAELRARSAKAVETWYEDGVLEMGERWADWEERLRDVEILVRRREAAKKREEGAI